jgi:hypothetical protein
MTKRLLFAQARYIRNNVRPWSISLLFEPRDLWIGVYWTKEDIGRTRLYVCLVPMLPILIAWWWD